MADEKRLTLKSLEKDMLAMFEGVSDRLEEIQIQLNEHDKKIEKAHTRLDNQSNVNKKIKNKIEALRDDMVESVDSIFNSLETVDPVASGQPPIALYQEPRNPDSTPKTTISLTTANGKIPDWL